MYKETIERELGNNLVSAWDSMKTIVGIIKFFLKVSLDGFNSDNQLAQEFYPGPDNIGSRLLTSCAEKLGPIFNYVFKSLSQQRVPNLWKQSTVIPVAKNNHPKVFNDYRPVTLTSLVITSFEKLLRKRFWTRHSTFLICFSLHIRLSGVYRMLLSP